MPWMCGDERHSIPGMYQSKLHGKNANTVKCENENNCVCVYVYFRCFIDLIINLSKQLILMMCHELMNIIFAYI